MMRVFELIPQLQSIKGQLEQIDTRVDKPLLLAQTVKGIDSAIEALEHLDQQNTSLRENNTKLTNDLREVRTLAAARLDAIIILADVGGRVARELGRAIKEE